MGMENILLTGFRLPLPRACVVNAAFVVGMACAFPAVSKAGERLALDVSYLAAPTDWCAADAGVPMLVTMDGPDIIRGPEDFPREVKVRRGSELTVVDGENIIAFNRADEFAGQNTEVIGRFSAEFQSCLSAFGDNIASGTWTLKDGDGVIVDSGMIEDQHLAIPMSAPFFRPVSGPTPTYYAEFGGRLLFTAVRPEAETQQTFLAKPAKE